MRIISTNLNKERNEIVDDVTILALSDWHLGDKLCNLKLIKKALQQIKEEKNTYTILNGDLANIALKTSKSDVYEDQMTPMQQMLMLVDLLEPIKDKILVILFIGLWLIQVKKNKDLKEQDELYMLLLECLLSQAYNVIPDKEEELISQIEEVLYEDTEEDI